MSKHKKLSRKDLKGPDAYQVGASSVAEWLIDNRSIVLGVIAGAIILALVSLGIAQNRQTARDRLSYQLAMASEPYFEAMGLPRDSDERAALLEEARGSLLDLYDTTSGTDQHVFLLTYLSNVYIETRKYPEAQGMLLQLKDLLRGDNERQAMVLYKLGQVYAAQYQPAEATSTLQDALTLEPNPIRDTIRKELDRLNSGSLDRQLTEQLKAAYGKELVASRKEADQSAN